MARDGEKVVVVATDGSDDSLHAARTGLEVLAPPDRVVVLTAVSPVDEVMLSGTGFAGGVMTPQMYDEMAAARKAEGEAVVERTAAALEGFPPEKVEKQVVWGDGGDAVCQVAEQLGATAIVIGSRGLGAVKRFLLGSVSSYVVQHARCPVLVVRHPDHT